MKKCVMVVVMAGCLASALLAEGIRVVRPHTGEELLYGWENTIEWLHTRGLPTRVRIELHRKDDTGPPLNINVSTENDGSFQWTISTPSPVNDKYFIRVATLDGRLYGDSGVFAIRLPRPRIMLTWPNGGETILFNTNQAIRWDPVDIKPGTLADITLLKNGSKVSHLISGCRADAGHAPWPVLDRYDPGSDYRLHIQVRNVDAGDTSDADFTLAASSAAGDLEPRDLRVGVDGKIYIDIRSSFPSLRKTIYLALKRPDWASNRTGYIPLNVVFDRPGEKSYSLETILPSDVSRGGSNFESYYEATLDPDNHIAETNERNNHTAAKLCGHRVLPVIETVYFGTQKAQRGQPLEVNNGRIQIWDEIPRGVILKVRALIRNYGYDVARGKVRIRQIGVQYKGGGQGGGGVLPEYRDRLVNESDFSLPAGYQGHLSTYETLETEFYTDDTDILVEYVREGEGTRTPWASFRFPASFNEMLREWSRSH